MKRKLLLAMPLFMAILLVSCETKFKKLASGLEYKIISDGKGKVIKDGNNFELTPYATYTKKDSLLITEENRVNQMVILDSTKIPAEYYKIFSQAKEGDSIVVREKTDSMIAKGAQFPWLTKGFFIVQSFRIQKVYTDSTSVMEAQKRISTIARAKDSIRYFKKVKEDSIAATKQIIEDDKGLKDYLAKNKINATKNAAGTYVEIISQGAGVINDSVGVKVNYTGKTFDGKVFDSNTDPSFGHVSPYLVNMAQPQVIKGWIVGLKQLGKGAKAKFYIPSALGYGSTGNGSSIGPNANLIFDIEIVDVLNQAQTQAQQKAEMMKQQMEMMKQQQAMQQAQKQQGGQQQPPQGQK
jgi:FKBP-type peptidyl-prolyl cis-trans isomerase FkpA